MINNKISAAHILRLYTWEMLEANQVLSEVSVNGKNKIPIIPVQDEPEFRDSGKAYIIYGWSENEENNVRPIRRGNLALRIIAEDVNQLNHITNILSLAFDDEDETANSVNHWSSNYPDSALVGIRFTWVKTSLIESVDPADTEGGQVEGTFILGYRYVTSQKVVTYRPGSKLDGSDGAWT